MAFEIDKEVTMVRVTLKRGITLIVNLFALMGVLSSCSSYGPTVKQSSREERAPHNEHKKDTKNYQKGLAQHYRLNY
jgi:hypothetical protein